MINEKTKSVTRQEYLISLYKEAFPAVASFVRKMGGTFEEAKDIFQEALLIYYEKKTEKDFLPQHSERIYVTGIAKHLWYKNYRENKRNVRGVLDFNLTEVEEPRASTHILRYLELSGKKCLQLLTAFYYDKMNMKELADKFGFSGERSATAQKYKCLEKVRGIVRERLLTKEDFYE
jgi:DNA-directed RNA polymerase specialized sigma24 family protein